MSLSQAGRQAINPITGESRFQAPDYRRSQEVKNEPAKTAESRRNFPNTSVPIENQEQSQFQMDRVAQLQDQVQMLEKQLTQEVKRNSKMLVDLEREVRTRGQMGDILFLENKFQIQKEKKIDSLTVIAKPNV